MTDSYRDRIVDPAFRRAVDLLDAGDADGLREHLAMHPQLVHQHVSFDGNYFTRPTLLHFTAENPVRHGKLPANICDLVDVIVDAGADVNASSHPDRRETVIALVASGCVPRQCGLTVALLENLVQHGADPNDGFGAGLGHGETLACLTLHRLGAELNLAGAAGLGLTDQVQQMLAGADEAQRRMALAAAVTHHQVESVRLLLQAGVDPKPFNPEGFHAHGTPLHHAASGNDVKIARLLLDHGARFDAPADKLFGGHPADWAAHEGKGHVMDLFIERGFPANLQQAAAWNASGTVRRILDTEPQRIDEVADWGTAMQQAAYHNRWSVIELLAQRGADVNKAEGSDRLNDARGTPLDVAIQRNAKQAISELRRRGGMTSQELADPTSLRFRFQSAVSAVIRGDVEALAELLDQTPELATMRYAYEGQNDELLIRVAVDYPGHWSRVVQTLQLLIDRGADVNARFGPDHTGETPLHHAASSDDVAALDFLLDHGADIDAVGAVIGNGTPLVDAVIFRQLKCAQRLLERGASFDLALAAGAGRLDLVKTFFKPDGSFHNPHGDMPHRDSTSDPAGELKMAVCVAGINGQRDCIAYLLDRGAPLNPLSVVGTTPLDELNMAGHDDCAAWLRSLGAKTSEQVKAEGGAA